MAPKGNFPCKDCKERYVGCHSICDKYAEVREDLNHKRDSYYRHKKEHDEFIDYSIGDMDRKSRRKNYKRRPW